MPLPLDHVPLSENRPTAALVVPSHDVQWCRPAFRPPSLPTMQQMFSEVPFSAQFAPKRFSSQAEAAR